MSTLTPSITRLKSMLALEEKRLALQHQIDELQQEISAMGEQLFDGVVAAATKTAGKVSRKARAKRGALKEQILAAMEAAGSAGVRVTELASTLGTKAANLHAWFHSTGKKVSGIARVAGGHYRLHPTSTGTAKSPAPAKAVKTAKSAGKAKGSKRGGLTEKILASLSGAGRDGIKVKEIAEKADTNYRNVAVWFATTGKKFPKIKKVRPATYRLAA